MWQRVLGARRSGLAVGPNRSAYHRPANADFPGRAAEATHRREIRGVFLVIHRVKWQAGVVDKCQIRLYIQSYRGTVEAAADEDDCTATLNLRRPIGAGKRGFEPVIANPQSDTETYRNPIRGADRYDGRRTTAVCGYSQFRMGSEKAGKQSARSQGRLRGRERNFRRLHFHPSVRSPWRNQVPDLRICPRQGNRGRLRAPRHALLAHLGTAGAPRRKTQIL